MRKLASMAIVALLATTSGMASAGPFNGAKQIAQGDYRGAERDIVAQRALYPDQVDLMINLATVYLRTGRVVEARRMYAAVTALPDEEVMLNGRPMAWSHALATDALRQLPAQIAAY